jgi:hypothetical protein
MFSNYFRYQGGRSGQGRTCCGLDPLTNGPKAVVPPALLLSPSFPLSSAPHVTRARTSWTITRTVAARCVHHHRASRNCFGFVLTSCAHRAPGRQGSARETLRRENPERSSRSEPRNCRYIRQQAIQRGVSGGIGVPYSQRTNGNNISLGGWGVTLSYSIARWSSGTSASAYIDGYSALSHSRLNDLAAWLRASPTGRCSSDCQGVYS